LTNAIKAGDFNELAAITMADSNQLHAVCLDSQPPLMVNINFPLACSNYIFQYLNDNSRRLIDFIVSYNQQKGVTVAAYTFDAGPNCCVFIESVNVDDFLSAFNGTFSNSSATNGMLNGDADYSNYKLPLKNIFVSSVGGGPVVLE
jgi:diphosphomevalonate decarboxylase